MAAAAAALAHDAQAAPGHPCPARPGALEVAPDMVHSWLSHGDRKPSRTAQERIRAWLAAAPGEDPGNQSEALPSHNLSATEQGRLALDLSVAGEADLRRRYGCSREVLVQCADLNPAIIERVRQALGGNGAARGTINR